MKYLIYVAIAFLLSSAHSYAGNTLIFGQSFDPIADISARVLKEAYKRINIEVEFKKMPAERSIENSNNGLLDGEVNRITGIEKQYSNLIMIPFPINFLEGVAFTKKQNITINGWDSLKPYTIAIRLGTKFAEYGTKGMNVSKFVSNEKIFDLVSENRYDICISSRVVGLYQIKKQNLIGIKALDPPLVKHDLFHYLNKKHEDFVPIISREIQKMLQEGRISEIRKEYVKRLVKSDLKIEQSAPADR